MKVIFLDVDGVLNTQFSESRCCGFIGIDDSKVKLLKEIVDATGAKIILSSSWRYGWERDEESCDQLAIYMNKKLANRQLHILDKTKEYMKSDDKNVKYCDRGSEIKEWLSRHPNIDKWVVLDDDIFDDYEREGIMPHLVKTSFYDDLGGLQRWSVDNAIKILNGEK